MTGWAVFPFLRIRQMYGLKNRSPAVDKYLSEVVELRVEEARVPPSGVEQRSMSTTVP